MNYNATNRCTFDRRLKIISTDIKEKIVTMVLCVSESLVNSYVLATDIIHSNKSQKVKYSTNPQRGKEGTVLCSDNDTDVR